MNIDDLERERQARERAEYRRLQRAALVKAYTEREGRPPVSDAEIVKRFPGQLVPTIDPARYLTSEEVARALAPMATG